MTIYFDMDGTIANFYGVDGWLDDLMAESTRPYREAKPLLNFRVFAKELHRIQNRGFEIGIVSWLSKNGTDEFNTAVTIEKMKWLKKHLPSVEWDEINIIPYGVPKISVVADKNGFLFDDEEQNRKTWGEQKAFDVENILEILKEF